MDRIYSQAGFGIRDSLSVCFRGWCSNLNDNYSCFYVLDINYLDISRKSDGPYRESATTDLLAGIENLARSV